MESVIDGVLYRELPRNKNYSAGEDGTVVSWLAAGSHARSETPRFLKLTASDNGYIYVFIGRARCAVHRLVLEAFYGECPQGMEACHGNGIKTDNRICNLRWDTRKSNHADKKLHGTHQCGSKNGASILTEDEVLEIKKRLVNGERNREIAKSYRVTEDAISRIRTGDHWSHLAPELNSQFPVGYPYIPGSVCSRAASVGIPKSTVHARIGRGWDIEKALSVPVMSRHRPRKKQLQLQE